MLRTPSLNHSQKLVAFGLILLCSLVVLAQKVKETTKSGQLDVVMALETASISTCDSIDKRKVHLSANGTSPNGNPLRYKWTAPVGRIVGDGANVLWDLSDVPAGQYKASVEAQSTGSDGTCTAFSSGTIVVRSCNVATCPKVEISCPTNIVPGQPLVFSSKLLSNGFPNFAPIYTWTISAGTIVAGQGTNAITVDTTALAGQQVTATLNMGGYAMDCPATCAVQIPVPVETCRKFDEFPDVARNDEKARLDNFAVALQNDPSNTGYIIIHPDRTGKANAAQIRNTRITDYLINTRGMDAGRVSSKIGPATDGMRMELWICPKGAAEPKP
jgi:hypothetical protein